MCLTGVDYFSTLGYQPGIAFLAAGVLVADRHADPGAGDAVRRAARLPPGGRSTARTARAASSMLEQLLPRWQGKLFVLGPARLRRHRLHHHDHALGRRRHRAHHREPVRAPRLLDHPVARDARAARRARRGLPARASARRSASPSCIVGGLPGAERGRARRRRSAQIVPAPGAGRVAGGALFAQHGSPLAMVGVALLLFPEAGAGPVRLRDRRGRDAAGAGRRRATRPSSRAGASATRASCCSTAAADHERVPARRAASSPRCSSPPRRSQKGGEANGRALAYLAHQLPGRRVRHGLRPQHDRRSSGSRAPRRWPGCSTSCRATCRATAWRPTGRGRRGRWCSSSPPSPSSSRSSSRPTSTPRAAPTPPACWC